MKLFNLILFASLFLFGCGEKDLYDPSGVEKSYESSFVNKFGVINPNQDWGLTYGYEGRPISKANGIENDFSGVIMCEDLGDTDDFDFNDVVFYAFIDERKIDGNGKPITPQHWAYIRVLACGATMPIYIGNQEIHDLFGVSTGTMVNTGSGVAKEPVEMSIDPLDGSTLNDIPVRAGDGKVVRLLTAQKGKAPMKICVPYGVKWSSERTSIEKTYPKFSKWVTDNIPFWE